MYGAKVIADSATKKGCRVRTVLLTVWRPILAEVNTHRMLSKSVPSSRAISVERMLKRINNNPALPVWWGKRDGPGMQAMTELQGDELQIVQDAWSKARDTMVDMAKFLSDQGLHQQITNRLIEPWMETTMVVTGTGWANLLRQRCHPFAQPEFRVVAEALKVALTESKPILRDPGMAPKYQWHLPFITLEEREEYDPQVCIRLSTARCARASYFQFDGTFSVEMDISLYMKLINAEPKHIGPFEHQAYPMTDTNNYGNLRGWKQQRLYFDDHFVEDDLYFGPYATENEIWRP